jgi:enamine deaminase RidA (YjgF/YER057c/UK114 family)
VTVLRFGSGGPWEAMIGYSRVVVRGDSAWVSGCTSVVDGEVRHPGDVAAQAREALAGLAAALENAGFALADVVRTRMYLTDISRWEELGRAHGEVFGEIRPASAMIGVSGLLDPAMMVEIEADAVRGAGA